MGTFKTPRDLQQLSSAAPGQQIPPCRFRLWWLHPMTMIAFTSGCLLLSALLPESFYRIYSTQNYLRGVGLLIGIGGILAFSLGYLLSERRRGPAPSSEDGAQALMKRWFNITTAFTLIGYVIWFALAISRGLNFSALQGLANVQEKGSIYVFREDLFETIPGITSCTQFAVATAILGALVWHRLGLFQKSAMGVVVLFALIKCFLISERLGIIEVLLPAGIAMLRMRVLTRTLSLKSLHWLKLAPFAAVVLLLAMFAGTEYLRGWRSQESQFSSFGEFVLWKFAPYYTTGLNNGALTWEERGRWPLPYYTMTWVWRFPLISYTPWEYEQLTGVDPRIEFRETLACFADQNFNNPGGLFCPTLDFGIAGGLLFWLACGFGAGRLYSSFVAGRVYGLVFYPIAFLSLLEMPRLLYWLDGRAFPSTIALLLCAASVGHSVVRRQTSSGRPAGEPARRTRLARRSVGVQAS